MSCEAIYGCVNEDSTFTLLARVHVDGMIWVEADVASITYKVWDMTDSSTTIASGSLVVADVVHDTLQTDAIWSVDATGYNFEHKVASTVITEPGMYRIEHKVTLDSGDVFFLTPYEIKAENVWT